MNSDTIHTVENTQLRQTLERRERKAATEATVYCLRWRPTGRGRAEAGGQRLAADAKRVLPKGGEGAGSDIKEATRAADMQQVLYTRAY